MNFEFQKYCQNLNSSNIGLLVNMIFNKILMFNDIGRFSRIRIEKHTSKNAKIFFYQYQLINVSAKYLDYG